MKTIKRIALPLIFILHLYPVLHVAVTMLTNGFDTRWRLTYNGYPLVYAVIVFISTLLGAIFRRQIMPEKGFGKACAPFLLPVALLNAFCAFFGNNYIVFIMVFLSCISALIVFLAANNKKWKRVLSFVIAAIFALIVTVMAPFAIIFDDFSRVTVVQKVKSPDGKYTAYLTDIDDGALGGDTRIEIMKKPVSLPLGKFTTHYHNEFDNWAGIGVLSEMTFEWLDNDTLLYGSTEIDINE